MRLGFMCIKSHTNIGKLLGEMVKVVGVSGCEFWMDS